MAPVDASTAAISTGDMTGKNSIGNIISRGPSIYRDGRKKSPHSGKSKGSQENNAH